MYSLCEGARRYDAVVTGSDQLWSPAGLPTNFYNLMFVPDEVRKISYASSFGVGQIPWYQKRRTANFLKRLDYISMRENRGSEIVKELTGLDVPVILDPVFNFNKEQWEKLIPVKKEMNGIMVRNSAKAHEKRDEFYKLAAALSIDKAINCVAPITYQDFAIERAKSFLYDTGMISRYRVISVSKNTESKGCCRASTPA